jgi:uncharacterized iron-regulated membrane protein
MDIKPPEESKASMRGPQDAKGNGYERRDANIGSLLKFGLWLSVLLVVVLFSMKWMFFYLAKTQQLGPPASPFESERVLPPTPRLQVEPRVELKTYCEGQQQQVESYGWADPRIGYVRIPVDRAIDKVLASGLPVRAPEEPTAAAPAASSTAAPIVPQDPDTLGPCGYIVGQPKDAERQ